MTWWDHSTGSIWSQPLGEALAGPRKGQKVDLLPLEFTSWASWRESHPTTLALDAPAGPSGFNIEELWVVVDLGEEARAYPVDDLQRTGVVNEVVAGVDIAVVSDPRNPDSWSVFSRQLDNDTIADLSLVGNELVDRATGTTFDPGSGLGIAGPLSDQALNLLPGFTSFPGDYDTFWPEGTVWTP